MARRSVLLAVAIVTALVGTLLIVLYVQGIDSRATQGQELVKVLVAKDVVNAGESVADAEAAGKFATSEVRREDMVPGALSSSTSVTGLVSTGNIYPGEQLIADKFGTIAQTESLVIPDDKLAISVELTDPERVAGFVNPGSEVAVFVTVTDPKSYTRVLLTRVTVIGVGQTTTTSRTTTDDSGAQILEEVPKTILTLALSQKESEKLIWADRFGELNFALLSENTKVVDEKGTDVQLAVPGLPPVVS
ncbi:Flp pilus assembly protein CpaB [Nocardioides hwasunensis]|uniref:Flp pilus assembly protein CpaB n=1 Tax=Nocardioides hwasunensis TaxID=397258 RepID=A0ABR8MD08_9ACTN|nr:Flp pilus assembly protein CpaB [Nocardioides hwasunensis]MBD3913405.1 Flp pilus assembly protein CpaB [Nocardioides hwasunensis]